MEDVQNRCYLSAPFRERPSLEHPVDRFSRNTCVVGVQRFTLAL